MPYTLSMGENAQNPIVTENAQFPSFNAVTDYLSQLILAAPSHLPPSTPDKNKSRWVTNTPRAETDLSYANQPQLNPSLLWLDIDGLPPETLPTVATDLQALAIAHIAYHTYTSTPAHPRIRVLVPLPDSATPDEYARYYSALHRKLNLVADNSANRPAKITFLPDRYNTQSPPPAQRIVSRLLYTSEESEFAPALPPITPDPPAALLSTPSSTPTASELKMVSAALEAARLRNDHHPRESWFLVACALRHTFAADPDEGYRLLDEFSLGAPGYNPTENRETYYALAPVRATGSNATLQTLIATYLRGNKTFLEDLMSSAQSLREFCTSPAVLDCLRAYDLSDPLREKGLAVDLANHYKDKEPAAKSWITALKKRLVSERAILVQEISRHAVKDIPGFHNLYYYAGANKAAQGIYSVNTPESMAQSTDGGRQYQAPYNVLDPKSFAARVCCSPFARHSEFQDLFGVVGARQTTALVDYLREIIPHIHELKFLPGFPSIVEFEKNRYLNTYRGDLLPKSVPVSEWTAAHHTMTAAVDSLFEWLFPDPRDLAVLRYFMGAVVVDPASKLEWVLTIQARTQGCGKTMIYEMLRSVVGHANCQTNSSDTALEKYNGWVSSKVLCCIDDMVVDSHSRELLDKLKPMITSDSLAVRNMYHEAVETPIFCDIMITSNAFEDLDLDKNDRRLAVLAVDRSLEELEEWRAAESRRVVLPEGVISKSPDKNIFALCSALYKQHPGVMRQYILDHYIATRREHPRIVSNELPWTSSNAAYRTGVTSSMDQLLEQVSSDLLAKRLPPLIDTVVFFPAYASSRGLFTLDEWEQAKPAQKLIALLKKRHTGCIVKQEAKPRRSSRLARVPSNTHVSTIWATTAFVPSEHQHLLDGPTNELLNFLEDTETPWANAVKYGAQHDFKIVK